MLSVLAIKLVTKNVKDAGRIRTLLTAAKARAEVSTSAPLHDRYAIDEGKMLIVGTSLNGFGKSRALSFKLVKTFARW